MQQLDDETGAQRGPDDVGAEDGFDGTEVAIVGMALRVPGAQAPAQFWANLRDGVESIRPLTDDELRAAGVSEAELSHPRYVAMGAPLDDVKGFDATFFGFSPRDAAIMDPQHRHFLEVAWEALEHAGYDPARHDGPIGIFGGSGHNVYMAYNLLTNPDLMESVGFFLVRHTSNDKDFLVTRASYLFDLKGPAVNVQTACSTSLVAVHMGVQSLLNREADMVLAGGVTIDLPLDRGYIHEPGEILSRDGHCRAFDAESSGTIFGSGAGVVVLKRLDDALDDGDTIHAVVRATAVNNDGSNKVGYLAPSVDGQAAAVGEAIALADIDPTTIGFIECHGTGTEIGDPIEVAALTEAFRAHTDASGFCAIGSVKTNIGHLDTAAGVVSLIKAALALENEAIPPTVHFEQPNPRIAFDGSPFYVNGELVAWPDRDEPRRAGVSSLGVGGTNAHVVLEQAPEPDPVDEPPRSWELLVWSAKGPTALDAATDRLADHLDQQRPDRTGLADTAHTLRVGRQPMDKRRFAVVDGVDDAVATLRGEEPARLVSGVVEPADRSVVFLFPGQGAQYPNMGRDLYDAEPAFCQAVDECAALLEPHLGLDIRTVLYPAGDLDEASAELARTAMTQPAIFTIEYAMARLWVSWGVEPSAMVGHSIGEYVAACLSGVFSLADALRVVAERGRLMQELPPGSMLAVPLAAERVEAILDDRLSLAARNGPEFCVVAGPDEAVDALQARLEADDVGVRRLHTSHAFHSSMMDPMLDALAEVVATTERNEPSIPYVSNVTGTWATPQQVADPHYWADHVRRPVDFVGGLRAILDNDPEPVLLEVGPGRTLATFAKQLTGPHGKLTATSMRHPNATEDDQAVALSTLGQLWAVGAISDWSAFQGDERRQRVPLPTYPFQHQEFWVEPGAQIRVGSGRTGTARTPDLADWFYQPAWTQVPWPAPEPGPTGGTEEPVGPWLVLVDDVADGAADDLGRAVATALTEAVTSAGEGPEVVVVSVGRRFLSGDDGGFTMDPSDPGHHQRLVDELSARGQLPSAVAYLLPLDAAPQPEVHTEAFDRLENTVFHGQVHLAAALGGATGDRPVDWWTVTANRHSVAGERSVDPLQGLGSGLVKVIGEEYPHIIGRSVDVERPGPSVRHRRDLVDRLVAELRSGATDDVVAHRGGGRWVGSYQRTPTAPAEHDPIRPDGTYLITGGTGGVGLELAGQLAQSGRVRLALTSRSGLPPAEEWDAIQAAATPGDPTGRQIGRIRAIEEAGAEVMVVAADVTDRSAMVEAVDQVVEAWGPIDGVFHAAGGLADGLIATKDRAEAAAVLAPKVAGTLVLDQVLRDAALTPDFLVLFSSTSAVLGAAGQVDYVAANTFLNAFAHQRADDACRIVAVGWGPWSEVGMTVRAAVRLGLVDDIDRAEPVDHPLLDRWFPAGTDPLDGPDVFDMEASPERHWVLDEHRLRSGTALLPGTGYLDLVRAAQASRRPGDAVELTEVFFLAPLLVPQGGEVTVKITIGDDGGFVVASKPPSGVSEHARGRIRTLDGVETPRLDLAKVASRCDIRRVDHDRYGHQQLVWGPRWNNLRTVRYGRDEALAELELPAVNVDDLVDHPLHPAVLDLATAGAQDLIAGFADSEDFFVPFSYGTLTQYRPLTPRVSSHIRYRGGDDPDSATFDVTLVDADGHILVDIVGFVMRRAVGEIAEAAAPEIDPPEKDPLLESLELGITGAEGMDALRRALAGPHHPELAVVAQDLPALVRRAGERRAANSGSGGGGIAHDRPDLSTPYVEPSTDRQRAVAAIWEEMLGVGGLGVHDDFYELGGHSLLLTQVSARVRKLTSADVSLMALFEASTIAQLAEAIDTAEAEQGADGPSDVPKLTRVSRSAYRVRSGALTTRSADGEPESGA